MVNSRFYGIDRYLPPAPDLSSKPAGRRRCCRSTGQTDGRTLNRFMTLITNSSDRVISKSAYWHSIHRVAVTQFRYISMPAGFRRHLVGKTLRNVCYSAVTYIQFVVNEVNDHVDILLNQLVKFYSNDTVNLHPLTSRIMPSYTHTMANVSLP